MKTNHFSRYTEKMDDYIVIRDLQSMAHIQFQSMLTTEVVKQLMIKRNGCNGSQYKIIDLFNNDVALYTLIFNGHIFPENEKQITLNFSAPQNFNVKTWSWLFPKGFPQTIRQLNSWVSYVGWVAYRRFS